jgi:hypothetical protein
MKLAISKSINFFLNKIIKWPLAFLLIFYIKEIFFFFMLSFELFITSSSMLYILGAIIFFAVNFSYSNRFLTFEHELTHAIFCFLTFKSNIRIDMNPPEAGAMGMCRYTGGTNWLIQISPYFFPTLTIFISLLYLLPINDFYPLLDICIGFSLAYHLKSNYMEFVVNMRSGSGSDTQKAGRIFSLIVIPILNLIVFSIIFRLIA